MNYGSNGTNGKFVVTTDTIAFYPSKFMKTLLFWSNWPDFVEDIILRKLHLDFLILAQRIIAYA